jgi:hypothetical protein
MKESPIHQLRYVCINAAVLLKHTQHHPWHSFHHDTAALFNVIYHFGSPFKKKTERGKKYTKSRLPFSLSDKEADDGISKRDQSPERLLWATRDKRGRFSFPVKEITSFLDVFKPFTEFHDHSCEHFGSQHQTHVSNSFYLGFLYSSLIPFCSHSSCPKLPVIPLAMSVSPWSPCFSICCRHT